MRETVQTLCDPDQFRSFIDRSPIFAWAKDEQGRYVFLNQTYLHTFPERLQNWAGKTDLEIWSQETAETFRKNDRRVLEEREVINAVEELDSADGGRSYLISKFPFIDAAGRLLVGGVGVDISEQRRLERELRHSEERLRLAQNAAAIGHFDWNLRTGETSWGESLPKIMAGALNASVSLLDRLQFVHPDDQPQYKAALQAALSGESDSVSFSYRAFGGDHTIRHRICQGSVQRDDRGQPIRIIGVIADITPQRKAEEAQRLERERQRLESVIHSMAEAVMIFDADGRCNYINEATRRLFHFDTPEAAPKTFSEVLEMFEATYLDGVRLLFEEWPYQCALRGQTVTNLEFQIRNRKSGLTVIASHGASPISDENGRIVAAVVSIHDVTVERTALDRLRESNAALHALSGQLLRLQDEERRRIARELHDGSLQGITAIAMNLLMIARSPAVMSDPETQRLITETQEIARRSSRELRTTSYLLHPPDLEEFGLIPALRSWADGFSQRTGIELDVDLEDPGRLRPEAETAIFRVAQEALANVHRHSGTAAAALKLSVFQGHLRLEVSDKGRGIPPEILARSPSRIGVGIMGMRERTRQLGGDLEILSDATGTTVLARIPRNVHS